MKVKNKGFLLKIRDVSFEKFSIYLPKMFKDNHGLKKGDRFTLHKKGEVIILRKNDAGLAKVNSRDQLRLPMTLFKNAHIISHAKQLLVTISECGNEIYIKGFDVEEFKV